MLTIVILYLLASNAVTLAKHKTIFYSRILIVALVFIIYINYNSLSFTVLDKGISLYGGLLNITTLTHVFNIFIFTITSIILGLTGFYPRKLYSEQFSSMYSILFSKFTYNKDVISKKKSNQFGIVEYALIISFVICGGVFLMSSGDLISIFLSIELQSYALYILCTIYRDSERATASGLMYFLLGGLSSCFILLGSALLYTLTGTTSLDNLYLIINIFDNFLSPNNLIDVNITNWTNGFIFWENVYHIQLAIVVMVVGFLFKISAAPFHWWSPDVYDGIPTIVTTSVAIIAKISIFAYLLDFVYNTQSNMFDFSWTNILVLSSLLSLVIGSILGLTQSRVKRLFAYSTISHIGFILLALSINSPESIQSYIFYVLQYSLSNLNAFIILLAIGYTLFLYVYKNDNVQGLLDKNNSPIQLISQLKGYFHINPFIAISMSITLFSFVGVPPLIGFFGKQMILSAALDKGYIFMSLVAIITSVVGAGYYLNIIKYIYSDQTDYILNTKVDLSTNDITRTFTGKPKQDEIKRNKIPCYIDYKDEQVINKKILLEIKDIRVSGSLSATISITTLIMLLFIYIPDESFNMVNIIALNIFNV